MFSPRAVTTFFGYDESMHAKALLLLIALCMAAPAIAADKELVEPVRTYKQGESVADIARSFYGNAHYELVIIKHNRIKDKNAIADGTPLKVGELANVLVAEGIKPEMIDEVNAVVRARYAYMTASGELMNALSASRKAKRATIPVRLREQVNNAAQAIETAAKALAKKGQYGDSATRFKNRLLEAAGLMRQLAKGRNDPKLDDRVHRLFAQAWVRAIMWTRNDDGDD